ncbi:hypothetical protein JD844_015066, partial [Phrynosoma platyrhinos]
VPLQLIESVECRDIFQLHLTCKDCKIIRCQFSTFEQCQGWLKRLNHAIRPPSKIEDLFSFAYHAWCMEVYASEKEQHGDLCRPGEHVSSRFKNEVERMGFDMNNAWRISNINEKYKLCSSYPQELIVPAWITDKELESVASFRSWKRIPAVVYRQLVRFSRSLSRGQFIKENTVIPLVCSAFILSFVLGFLLRWLALRGFASCFLRRHQSNGAVISRCGQPEVSWWGWRNADDEHLVQSVAKACASDSKSNGHKLVNGHCSRDFSNGGDFSDAEFDSSISNASGAESLAIQPQKLLILDARSYAAAVANRAKGGGCECPVPSFLLLLPSEYYPNCEVVFMGMANIHSIRKSFQSLRLLCTQMPDPGKQSPRSQNCFPLLICSWLSALESTKWLQHLSVLLKSALLVVHAVDRDQRPVLVHCSDGWDRTPQIVALAKLLLDPYYRSIEVKLVQHTYSCLFGTFLCNNAKERGEKHTQERTCSVWSLLRAGNKAFKNLLYTSQSESVRTSLCCIRCAMCETSCSGAPSICPVRLPLPPQMTPVPLTHSLVPALKIHLWAGNSTILGWLRVHGTPGREDQETFAMEGRCRIPFLSRLPKTRSFDNLTTACDSSVLTTNRRSSDPSLNEKWQEHRRSLELSGLGSLGDDNPFEGEGLGKPGRTLAGAELSVAVAEGQMENILQEASKEDGGLEESVRAAQGVAVQEEEEEEEEVALEKESLGKSAEEKLSEKTEMDTDTFVDNPVSNQQLVPQKGQVDLVGLHNPLQMPPPPERERWPGFLEEESANRLCAEVEGSQPGPPLPLLSDAGGSNMESSTETLIESGAKAELAQNVSCRWLHHPPDNSAEGPFPPAESQPTEREDLIELHKLAATLNRTPKGGIGALHDPPTPSPCALPLAEYKEVVCNGEPENKMAETPIGFAAAQKQPVPNGHCMNGEGGRVKPSLSRQVSATSAGSGPLLLRGLFQKGGHSIPGRQPASSSQEPPARSHLDDDGMPVYADVIQQRLRQIESGHQQEVETLKKQLQELRSRLESQCLNSALRCNGEYGDEVTSIPDSESSLDQNCLSRCSTEIFSEASWEQVDKQDAEVTRWLPDHLAAHCYGCDGVFWLVSRKHHCR